MQYSPLLATSNFDGIRTDVLTAAAGILSVLLIVLAIGLIVRVLSR